MDGTEPASLVEKMLPYERSAFLWLNESHNVFWDSFMWIYSGKMIWIPLAIVALIVFCYKVPWKVSLLLIICFVLLATLCDQLSSSLVKPIFERLRPTHHPDFKDYVTIVNNYRGGRFGFISSHAANGFGVATFLSLLFKYRRFTIVIFTWASVTAYSRIYLGVHFITDILGGMILGGLVGFLVYLLFQYGRIKILKQSLAEVKTPAYSYLHANIIISSILVLVTTIFCISFLNFLYGYDWLL
jgi:undecaprenyl-diphosphatase